MSKISKKNKIENTKHYQQITKHINNTHQKQIDNYQINICFKTLQKHININKTYQNIYQTYQTYQKLTTKT